MDLVRHLSYFTAIAAEEHFGRAARRLGMRQPPLSQGLRRLEAELGVDLFDRNSAGVRLTDAGRALLPAALRVLDEVEHLRLLARRQHGPQRPAVRVRVAPGLGPAHYAALVAACRRAAADADVDVTEQPTAAQVADLLAGRADIGFVREPVALRGVSLGPSVSVSLRCVLPADHEAARRGHVAMRELAGNALVMPPRADAAAAYDEVIAACERHGFLPETIHETVDDRVARGLVAAGGIVAFTTDEPGGDGPDTRIVRIDGDPLGVRFRLCWRGDLGPQAVDVPPAAVRVLTSTPAGPFGGPGGSPPAVSELPAVEP
ncbi:MAG TPA: LysR family transcriptional regulator [Jiangellaceae bacterium]